MRNNEQTATAVLINVLIR